MAASSCPNACHHAGCCARRCARAARGTCHSVAAVAARASCVRGNPSNRQISPNQVPGSSSPITAALPDSPLVWICMVPLATQYRPSKRSPRANRVSPATRRRRLPSSSRACRSAGGNWLNHAPARTAASGSLHGTMGFDIVFAAAPERGVGRGDQGVAGASVPCRSPCPGAGRNVKNLTDRPVLDHYYKSTSRPPRAHHSAVQETPP
ncbi:hypothetical protein CT19431_MP130049 [Cupriavidus taiwanensis]|nr:hypothetical protein CT19431_MP130049 [Cupriavidus taiwanensis]